MREYEIHPVLAPYVKCIWSLESDAPIRDSGRERILPDSCIELVFHFGDTYRTHFASGESSLQPASFVVGQMRRFLEIEPTGRAGLIAVRFHARGAYLFFHRPLHELAAGVVDLEDLWQARAREWTERIALARGMNARLRFIEQALLSLLRSNGRTDPAVDRALHLIGARRGLIRVDDLAKEIGMSCRHLSRQFQRAVGVSPKEYGRIKRFLRALELMTQDGQRSLTEVALDSGFYEQAHFNHEFNELAGMRPGDLAAFPNVSF
jgi:methylphosphotriester-DNA--protein-cysteine methyltransferase